MGKKLKKRGKYGSYETVIDEEISKKCVNEIYQKLQVNYPIPGWEYRLLERIPEMMYYERDINLTDEKTQKYLNENVKGHNIEPDLPTIVLREKKNHKNFVVVLSGDDKYQDTQGNAIERSNKNHRAVFEEKMCANSDIVPYVILCSGPAFVDEDGNYRDYLLAKIRQMMPYNINDGRPGIWTPDNKISIYKRNWNLFFMQRERFTYEQQYEILSKVAFSAVEYYKNKFKDM